MLRLIAIIAMLGGATMAVTAATPEEKKAAVLNEAQALVSRYGNERDPVQLQQLDNYIERTWNNFVVLYGTKSKLASDFAMLRARSASAAVRKNGVSEAWKQAIKLLSVKTPGSRRLSFYTQAANASSAAKEYRAAEQFFAAARVFAVTRGENTDKARLYLRLQELKTTAEGMEWRRLNDSLLDMRLFSEGFVSWSIPRLDALLGEAEIRLAMQPESDSEKREMLGDLKAKIILVQKGMEGAVPPSHLDRIRTLFYALEDHYKL